MQDIKVVHQGASYSCKIYEQDDESTILAVIPAWREYVLAVSRMGNLPQVPSAFSQAFCCWKLGLANNKRGTGIDAFRLDEAGRVQQAIEIKSTSTALGRNDIRLYSKIVNGRNRTEKGAGVDIDFDELYWLAFSDSSLSHFDIYCISRSQVILHDETYTPNARGGRINVSLSQLIKNAGLVPVRSGKL